MTAIKLNNGTEVRPYRFQCNGHTMTVWARNQKEAIKRAEKIWGSGVPIPLFGVGYP